MASEAVRFSVYLPKADYAILEKLNAMSGGSESMSETIRKAVKAYVAFREELDKGKSLVMSNPDGSDPVKVLVIH